MWQETRRRNLCRHRTKGFIYRELLYFPSFNVYIPEEDPELQMEVYTRSPEQNELLGLDQMNVD